MPVYGISRAPGATPVAAARLPGAVPEAGLGPHAHDFLILGYAHRADTTVLVDDRRWRLTDGDLFLLAPGQVVGLTADRPLVDDGWVTWFPTDGARLGAYGSWRSHPLLARFARGAERVQRLRVPPAERPGWMAAFAALDAELRERRDGYPEAALAHLTLLLVGAARLGAAPPTGRTGTCHTADEPLITAVFEVIERRYRQRLSLTDVAAELALTPGHLTTVVRRKTGRTVQQWITDRRLQEARALLSETDLTVAAVARRAGYPDVSYFIKRFRDEHRVTPTQWRAGPGHERAMAPRSSGAPSGSAGWPTPRPGP
ncbi:helix-turn-helix transcriptional regulator [Dactylosporangium vinaceum]|uniref:AraC family transcriptional regulator n=1 Tax=Dactylosporangium vinaceum TaxID=53362 RepID=A0ABV5LZL5_9ACTN|nr:AraC family transcriptional regulator [Dactylosporangium vinaceum]UAC02235.1 helix-turn-helix transcriptional regulator [Dactylosporangium vinaceum]